jgi:hypothetical protein
MGSSRSPSSSNLSLLRLGSRKTLFPTSLQVNLGQTLASVVKLNAVDELLHEHKREAYTGNNPGHSRVHLVGTSKLESSGAEGIGEDLSEDGGVDLGTSLKFGTNDFDRLDEVWRDERRREAEKIERNEEELVEGAEGEKNTLEIISK